MIDCDCDCSNYLNSNILTASTDFIYGFYLERGIVNCVEL